MTLQQILYVLTIADYGSMNQAAAALYISQPTLTSAVKELEREIGRSIFQRNNKGVVPTSDGLEFLMHARQVYQQYELLIEQYGKKHMAKRRFSVSTQHYSFATKAFVETVKQFDTSQFAFAIRETKTRNVIRDVGSLRSEIGILYLSSFNRKMITKMLHEQELEFHPLMRCHAYVYLWKHHPLAGEQAISLEQLEP